MARAADRLPTLFIPHGGGPWPFMPPRPGLEGVWDGLAAYLEGLDQALGARPKAVLVVSAHWDEPGIPTVATASHPALIFDYYGFPDETYRLRYPAPGSPDLARQVRAALSAAGLASDEDGARGFDHGVFIPFMLIYPEADVPIVQLSMRRDLDPAAHLAIGRALEPLRDEGVLIVGSGMSYHNMRLFMSSEPSHVAASRRFDDWVTAAVEAEDRAARDAALIHWSEQADARACHFPDVSHFVPLVVAAGAGGADRGRRTLRTEFLGKPLSAYQFG